ncbi:MAG: DUF1232 domain-containing protein [Rikenellaceae bacterium]|nr:DUF1232 domain-containing protein [Rikenellaceae bacterium]
MRKPTDIEKYQGNYSESKLLGKLPRVARWAGAKVVYAVLLLYYVLQSPNVSSTDKSKIWGALGYFILPTDLILDFIPLAGYSDDLAALLIALHAVAKNVTPEIKARAKAKLATWFSDIDHKKIDEVMK